MMMSGKNFLKSHVLSWRRKVYSDWKDVTSFDRAFQVFGPAAGKARPLTVERLFSSVQLQKLCFTPAYYLKIMTFCVGSFQPVRDDVVPISGERLIHGNGPATQILKPVHTVAEKCDSRRISPLSRLFRRQSHFSATVWTGL